MFIRQIISEINSKFEGFKTFGLTELISRSGKLMPAEINENGECTYVGPDDLNDASIYHRLDSMTLIPADRKSFQKNNTYKVVMSMYVFARRDKICQSADELALSIQLNMPDSVSLPENIKKVSINIVSVNLNSLQVFRDEFVGYDYFLKPEQFLIKVNYQIESILLKCFTTQIC